MPASNKIRFFSRERLLVMSAMVAMAMGVSSVAHADVADTTANGQATTNQATSQASSSTGSAMSGQTVTVVSASAESSATASATSADAESAAAATATTSTESQPTVATDTTTTDKPAAQEQAAVAQTQTKAATTKVESSAATLIDPTKNSDYAASTRSVDTTATVDPTTGLTEAATQIANQAGLDVSQLSADQKQALNRIYQGTRAAGQTTMTYRDFAQIADSMIKRDSRYAIPFFNASQIKDLPAATAKNAQTGKVETMDIWDSWPVQDVKTGEVVNWHGYQLVIAMMGVPNVNDNHIYLLYNKFGSNDLSG